MVKWNYEIILMEESYTLYLNVNLFLFSFAFIFFFYSEKTSKHLCENTHENKLHIVMQALRVEGVGKINFSLKKISFNSKNKKKK